MVPADAVDAIRRWCEQPTPPDLSDQVRLETVVERSAVTIVERRPPWRDDRGDEWTTQTIARLRYTATRGMWTLYRADTDNRWSRYELLEPVPGVNALLAEIDRDPTGIFWG